MLDLRCNPVITEFDYLGKIYRESEKKDSNVNFVEDEKHTSNFCTFSQKV